jgi:hypothetical protein
VTPYLLGAVFMAGAFIWAARIIRDGHRRLPARIPGATWPPVPGLPADGAPLTDQEQYALWTVEVDSMNQSRRQR